MFQLMIRIFSQLSSSLPIAWMKIFIWQKQNAISKQSRPVTIIMTSDHGTSTTVQGEVDLQSALLDKQVRSSSGLIA